MMKRILALTMALALALCLLPGPALAQEESREATPEETTWETTEPTQEETQPEETEPEETQPEETEPEETMPEETEPEETQPELPQPVKVTLTVAGADRFAAPRQTRILAAEVALEVPWFDLVPYGIPQDTVEITLHHLLIYATERLFCGLDPRDAGQGYLAEADIADALDLNAAPQRLWGWEGEVLCFLNDQAAELTAPLTADSRVMLAVLDPETEGEVRPALLAADSSDVEQGKTLTLTTEPGAEVFCISTEDGKTEGDIRQWHFAGTAGEDGILEVTTEGMSPGEYLFAVAPGEGEGILLPRAQAVTVEEGVKVHRALMGDVNGDGVVDGMDAACLSGYINGRMELTEQALRLADLNGDGKINILDVALIYRACNTAPDGAQ